MSYRRQQPATVLLDDKFPHNSSESPETTSAASLIHDPCEELEIGMAHVHCESQNHAARIDILPDDILLEIFVYCTRRYYWDIIDNVRAWQRLVHVCQRWRQIVYASPRYLDLFLYFSNGTPIRKLSCWPELPIFMSYSHPFDEDDVMTLLKHPDRVRWISLGRLTSLQLRRVLTLMQKPFPLLTHLEFYAPHGVDVTDVPALPRGFLGGSAPCLQLVLFDGVPLPEFPSSFLASRDLASLHLDMIPMTGYISPEAILASLAVLTRLESLRMGFPFWKPYPEQRTGDRDPPIRVVLPALNELAMLCWREYMEDFVSRIDAPRLDDLYMRLDERETLWLPRLSLFITRTDTLRFGRARIDFYDDSIQIEIDREFNVPHEPRRPHCGISTSFDWAGTHVSHLTHLVGRKLAMFANLRHFYIRSGDDHPSWEDDIDNIEWQIFFQQFTGIRTLHIQGRLARQVARALEDVPEEMVTEVFPSLEVLLLEDIRKNPPR
ncbi:hypothetical protein V8E53_011115 [Lactarius tabidus]